ncbi:MAG: hypothetical protein HXS48_21570 [Theionarchaea archaeon]|nr:hypothetical protein [Theionarchaea archaeon]
MKKIVVFTLVFLLVGAAASTSQPFTATVVIFPGCGSQFMYGQKACGELYVSDDAWVTRWVEDQYGNTWYHWGTRYYTAGTHTFCGYMGLPIGLHIMKIHAVRVSDGAIVEDQCQYTVCCGYSVWIPDRPMCNCEDVIFTAEVDRTQVTPGDYVTVTVTVTNNMAPDCRKKFDAGHLEIDWGILGGDTSPLEKDISVHPGETRTILEERHLMPPVSEGDYNVVIFYSDSECTWIDYATISVVLPTAGSFEIVSYPDVINMGERGRIRLLIRNQSQKDAEFTLSVNASPGVYLARTGYTVTVPRQGYKEINVEFRPEEAGLFTIELALTSEGEPMGTASLLVRAEKPLSGSIEIVSPPQNVAVNESTSVVLRVTNPGEYDTVYQISAVGIDVQTSAIPELYVPKSQSRDAEIFITPTQEGVHQIEFRLEAEGQLMGSKSVSFEAEKEFPLFVGGAVIIGVLAVIMVVYLVLRRH